MNERIKELFNKASVYAYGQNPGENSYGRPVDENKYEEDRYTKFAELLEKEFEAKHFSAGYIQGRSDGTIETVRECADLFEIEYGKSEVSGNEVATVLKEYFGVEE